MDVIGTELFSLLALGTIAGLLSVFLGVGGGIIIVPFLGNIVALSARETIATSLSVVTLILLVNVTQFHRRGLVLWPIVWKMGPAAAVGSFGAGSLTRLVDSYSLRIFLGSVFIFLAIFLAVVKNRSSTLEPRARSLVITSWISGLIGGATGIGGGVLLGALALRNNWIKNEVLSPTINAVVLCSTLFGVMAFLPIGTLPESLGKWGEVRLDLALPLFIGAMISALSLQRWQHLVPKQIRQVLFLVLLAILGLKVIVETYVKGS